MNIYSIGNEVQETIPYTYYIEWSNTGMKYYGVRYAKSCNPTDFWVKYFTSSIYVDEYVKIHGPPDIKIIRKTFPTVKSAILWEYRVLKRLNVAKRDDYLNKRSGKAVDWSDPEIKKRHSIATGEASVKNWKNPEIRKKRTIAIKESANREDVRSRNSELRKGTGNGRYDHTIYSFIHQNGNIEICTQFEMRDKYKMGASCLHAVIHGTQKTTKGWRIL